MTDTTLSLAARLAANLIVDAINLAKPGVRLAGKIGDRALNLIGGAPFDEREAQRFLLDGADALNEMEERVEVLEPGWAAAPRLLADDPAFGLAPHGFNTMPNWQAPKSSAPVAPKPTAVAGSAEVVASPATASGSLIPNGPEYRIGAFGDPNADVHLCKTWDGACHCEEVKVLPDFPGVVHGHDDIVGVVLTDRSVQVEIGHDMGLSAAAEMFPQHTKTPDSQGEQPVGVGVAQPGTGGTRNGPVGDLADELCDAVLDCYDHAPMVGGSQLSLPLRDEFLEGFDWESAARILLTYFSVTRK